MRVAVNERHADAAVNLASSCRHIQEAVLIQQVAEIFPRPPAGVRAGRRYTGQRQFVATEAREQIGIAQARLQLLADLDQQLVAGGVAGGVVEDTEAVEVNVQQRRYFLAAG